ncbi:MAG: phytanoyl-CoA dioxygenase family protein [Anaerolineaceae bacterium]|nr:phytanoyl-CoA dioxygenase family protein [Anaerolineaceae bacterium]
MSTAAVDVDRFHRDGFLFPFTIFESDAELAWLRSIYWRLRALLPPDTSTQEMKQWHDLDLELWQLGSNLRILDLLEPILGPDFYLWGSQFFSKDPGDRSVAGWHQDAAFWPLTPHRTVTVWLAFEDSDVGNGAMQVIPGTHRAGILQHAGEHDEHDVLNMRLERGNFSRSDAVHLCLRAGQVSLHDDNLVHGSAPNESDRLRCGLTLRYSASEVRVDAELWPTFRACFVRGQDRHGHNPLGQPPTDILREFVLT